MRWKPEKRRVKILEYIKLKGNVSFGEIVAFLRKEGNPVKERQLYQDIKMLREKGINGRGIPIKLNNKKEYYFDSSSPVWNFDSIDDNIRLTLPFVLSLLKEFEYVPAVEHVIKDLDNNHSVSAMNMDKMMVIHNKSLNEGQIHGQKGIMTAVYSILKNIKDSTAIEFMYSSVHSDIENNRNFSENALKRVFPLQIRVFNCRFYLIAVPAENEKETDRNDIRTYCIDNILNFRVDPAIEEDTEETEGELIRFNWKDLYERLKIDNLYRHAIGIVLPVEKTEQPVIIKRWFKNWAASLIEAVPLHHSQKILVKKGDEILISLKVYDTPDVDFVFRGFREFSWEEIDN